MPGTIRAVDFDSGSNGTAYWDNTSGNNGGVYRSGDVDIQGCSEGGYNVAWISEGEWLNYTVSVPTQGTYTLHLRVASPSGGAMNVQFNGENKTGTISIPATGGWQTWTTVSTTVNLGSGTQTMKLAFESRGFNVAAITVEGGGSSAAPPSSGGTKQVPALIEAESFDDGGNGAAYRDDSSGNSGGAYRSTDVDIEGSSEGGHNIGWVSGGEWLNYSINVPSAGRYSMAFRVAAPNGGSLRANFNGSNKTGSVAIPATGGWQNWTTVTALVDLSAGAQVMQVYFETGGINFNNVNITSGGSGEPAPPSGGGSASPFGGSAAAVPGTIEAEAFDAGGAGVAYSDNTSGNAGGAYRSTDVDIEAGASGYNLGWAGAGEWLQYTVNVGASGTYNVTARVASSGDGGRIRVDFNGQPKGYVWVPNTGGWGSYQDVTVAVTLDAGVQPMRVVFESNGQSGGTGNLDYIRIATPSSTPPPSAGGGGGGGGGGGRLRVMTWNIAFGSDPWGQARVIADSGADVVMLQEVSLWDEDMRTTYPDRLRQLTGQTWYSVYSPHSGRYSPNEGTMILSRLPFVQQSIRNAYDRGFSRVQVSVGGVNVNLLNAHLDWYDTNMRTAQLEDFMWWGRQFSGPRISGGDFNSWWGEYWIERMLTEYTDTWLDIKGTPEGGNTLNGAVRFDYLFRNDPNSRVLPSDIWTIPTGHSDHYPVVADYNVR